VIRRLILWLREPVLPPRWLRRWRDPANADWTTFGRIIGGRIRALDDDGKDSPAKRAWRKGGEWKPELKPTPRWQWILAGTIVTVEVAALALLFYYINQHAHFHHR
jgi:hypothetical protein